MVVVRSHEGLRVPVADVERLLCLSFHSVHLASPTQRPNNKQLSETFSWNYDTRVSGGPRVTPT